MNEYIKEEFDFENVFIYAEIESEYLTELVNKVLSKIHKVDNIYEIEFHTILERVTFSGTEAELTAEGEIILDSKQLKKYDDDVAMASIAYIFASYALGQHLSLPQGIESKYEVDEDLSRSLEFVHAADELASKWGFDVEKFRRICGSLSGDHER